MYWERDQEITLLHLVLEANHPDEDRDKVDQIVCGLIEMGLVDCDRAPWAQRAWSDSWDGGYEVPRAFVKRYYVTEGEYLDMEEYTCDAEGCENSLDDGEGYDGYCGEHADQYEAEGRWS